MMRRVDPRSSAVKRRKPKKIKYSKLGMTEDEVKEYLTQRTMAKFNDWIGGQTCPVLMIDGKEVCGYYQHDVERFADMVLENKPTYFD